MSARKPIGEKIQAGAGKIPITRKNKIHMGLFDFLKSSEEKKLDSINESIKNSLRYGPGSPGETTRTLTKLFLNLCDKGTNETAACISILELRLNIYKQREKGLLLSTMILSKSVIIDEVIKNNVKNQIYGNDIPFVVFVDLYISNELQDINYRKNFHDYKYENLLNELIIEEYNKLVGHQRRIRNNNLTNFKTHSFLFHSNMHRSYGL